VASPVGEAIEIEMLELPLEAADVFRIGWLSEKLFDDGQEVVE
jgi:hypothetical protein